MWIGHNDLLNNLGHPDDLSDRYGKEVKDALKLIAKTEKGNTIFLMPVVDITEVYAALEEVVWGKKKRLLRKKKELTGAETWKAYFPLLAILPSSRPRKSFR